MEAKIAFGKDGSKGKLSKKKLYHTLSVLLEEKEIEMEQEQGKKAVRYFMKGRRPTIATRAEPSEFDQFVMREGERLISDMMQTSLMMNPQLDGYPAPINFNGVTMAIIESYNIRFSNMLRLVEIWEKAREVSVKRPWGPDTADVPLHFGPEARDPLRPAPDGERGRYPDPIEWFLFLCNVIDTVSMHIKAHQKKPSGARKESARADQQRDQVRTL